MTFILRKILASINIFKQSIAYSPRKGAKNYLQLEGRFEDEMSLLRRTPYNVRFAEIAVNW